MNAMISIQNLTKHFGPIRAVRGISFDVRAGEVLGFLGPNGAGKSTTMKMVTGFLPPTSGTALVQGHDVVKDPLAVKRRIGYLPEGAPAYADMTPQGFLEFIAKVRGFDGRARRERVERAAGLVELGGVLHQPIDTLSKGYKRRVGLAQAILHDPEVLIMDEPTDGLDPNQKHQVRRLIRDMASSGGKAIVLSTHILEEVEAVCTRVVVIAGGSVVADCTPAEFRARSRHHNAVRLVLRGGLGVEAQLRDVPGVESVEEVGVAEGRFSCTVLAREKKPIIAQLAAHAARHSWQVESMSVEPGRMDDVFRSLTAGGAKE